MGDVYLQCPINNQHRFHLNINVAAAAPIVLSFKPICLILSKKRPQEKCGTKKHEEPQRFTEGGGLFLEKIFIVNILIWATHDLTVLPSQSFSSNKLSFRRYNIQQTQATAFQILFQSPNLKLSKPGQFPVVYFLNALYLLHTLRGVVP